MSKCHKVYSECLTSVVLVVKWLRWHVWAIWHNVDGSRVQKSNSIEVALTGSLDFSLWISPLLGEIASSLYLPRHYLTLDFPSASIVWYSTVALRLPLHLPGLMVWLWRHWWKNLLGSTDWAWPCFQDWHWIPHYLSCQTVMTRTSPRHSELYAVQSQHTNPSRSSLSPLMASQPLATHLCLIISLLSFPCS